MLDPGERLRTNVMYVPSPYKSSVIRAPVPWKQSRVVAQQYCRHNLFITNPIIVRIRITWEKRYRRERFVNTRKLRGKYDNPLSPEEMKAKIEEQCSNAKDLLMNVSMYRVRI